MPVYKKITMKQTVKFTCVVCGKKRSKVVCVVNTISPFNRNEDGSIRSREEVKDVVRRKFEAEVEKVGCGTTCNTCLKSYNDLYVEVK